MVKRIILGASKGGVSKTTSTVGIALNLALRHKKVLLIDADSQGNLSDLMSRSYYRWHGKSLQEPNTMMYSLAKRDLNSAVVKMSNYLYFIPSSMDFSNYPSFLLKHFIAQKGSITKKNVDDYLNYKVSYLSKMLDRVEEQINPDYVFCDIPPSSDLFESSCLYYIGSHDNLGYLFLVMQTQQHSFQGVQYFVNYAGDLIKRYQLRYQIAGVLPVILQKNAPSDNNIMDQARKNYGEDILMTPMPFRERIKRYAISGVSMPGTQPRDFHDTKITQMFTRITNELLQRINQVDKDE